MGSLNRFSPQESLKRTGDAVRTAVCARLTPRREALRMPGRGELGDRYRQAIARFATGVTVITACDGERLAGMTASAVASLSLPPPRMLVCINNRVPTHSALERSRRFGVNVLEE